MLSACLQRNLPVISVDHLLTAAAFPVYSRYDRGEVFGAAVMPISAVLRKGEETSEQPLCLFH